MIHSDYKIMLQISHEILSVCRLEPGEGIPDWVKLQTQDFLSITQTKDELSIVCNQNWVPKNIKAERNWRILKIKGQLDFALVGILKQVITPLSEKEISVFTISTFDTDYILLQDQQFDNALEILKQLFEIEYIV